MGGGQGGCERRIEDFVKIQKEKFLWGVGGRGLGKGRVWGGGGQGGCERRIEVFGKIQKKKNLGGGGRGGGGGGMGVGGVGLGGESGWI